MSDESVTEEVWMSIPGFPEYEITEEMKLRRIGSESLMTRFVGDSGLHIYKVKHTNGTTYDMYAVELRHMAERALDEESEEVVRVAAETKPRTLEDNIRDRAKLDEDYHVRSQELTDEYERLSGEAEAGK